MEILRFQVDGVLRCNFTRDCLLPKLTQRLFQRAKRFNTGVIRRELRDWKLPNGESIHLARRILGKAVNRNDRSRSHVPWKWQLMRKLLQERCLIFSGVHIAQNNKCDEKLTRIVLGRRARRHCDLKYPALGSLNNGEFDFLHIHPHATKLDLSITTDTAHEHKSAILSQTSSVSGSMSHSPLLGFEERARMLVCHEPFFRLLRIEIPLRHSGTANDKLARYSDRNRVETFIHDVHRIVWQCPQTLRCATDIHVRNFNSTAGHCCFSWSISIDKPQVHF